MRLDEYHSMVNRVLAICDEGSMDWMMWKRLSELLEAVRADNSGELDAMSMDEIKINCIFTSTKDGLSCQARMSCPGRRMWQPTSAADGQQGRFSVTYEQDDTQPTDLDGAKNILTEMIIGALEAAKEGIPASDDS